MDRGEVEVEEERQARVKSVPVLPTDKERKEHEVTQATFRSWYEACVAGRGTEDSHKRSATEPSVPLVAMDYGFFGRDTDVELATILVLRQRPHGAGVSLSGGFAKVQSLMRPSVCWRILTLGAERSVAQGRQRACHPGTRRRGSSHTGREDDGGKESHQPNGAVRECSAEGSRASRELTCVLQEKLGY